MYLSLARKYRPKTFASVAVQSHVSNTLKGAIARGRVAHGYLLCGPRGVGKTTLARVLAMALNCDRRVRAAADTESGAADAGEPCGECASCQRIWSGSASLDVVEIDAASNRGVDDARELRERAMYAPSTAEHYKVYIVDEAHMLTREAWNALLKILEEPPPRVVFVFATTEPHKIAQFAAPVLSRLQRFDFKRISPADVRERLATVLAAEGVSADSEALGMLARAADGSMRDALSLADQALSLGDGSLSVERVREALGLVPDEEYLRILDLVASGNAGELFGAVARLVDEGVDLSVFLGGFADVLRGQLALALGGAVPELSERMREALQQRAGQFASGDLLRMLSAVTELEPRFRRSGQQRILLESLLVRFALMDRTVALEEVLRSMGRGERGGGQGAAPHERTPSPRGSAPDRSGGAGSSKTAPREDRAEDRAVERAASPRSSEPGGSVRAQRGADAWDAAEASAKELSAPTAVALAMPPEPLPQAVPRAGAEPPSLNVLVERWGEVVGQVRASRRAMLASALERAVPAAVTARGEITLELEEPLETYVQVIEGNAGDVVAAAATLFPGITRVRLVRPAADAPRGRLTEEAAKAERLEHLCRRDPSLAAAVRELDLELVD